MPLAIQTRLSFVLSFSFFFFESSTFFHKFAILLVTSFLPFFDGVAGDNVASSLARISFFCLDSGVLLFSRFPATVFLNGLRRGCELSEVNLRLNSISALDGDLLFGVGMIDLPPSATVFSPWLELECFKLDFELLELATLLALLILVVRPMEFCSPTGLPLSPCFEAERSLKADVLVW